jgi:hypothetical protein
VHSDKFLLAASIFVLSLIDPAAASVTAMAMATSVSPAQVQPRRQPPQITAGVNAKVNPATRGIGDFSSEMASTEIKP